MINKKQVDFLEKLKRKKYRDLHQKFLVESPKVIWENYKNSLLDSVYVTDNFYKDNEDKMVFDNTYRMSEKDLKNVSNQVNPLGMLALFNMPKVKKFNFRLRCVLLLENIQDPGNLGTIIRTADWFGFNDIFLSQNCAEIYNPKVVAASMGSVFDINIYSNLNLMDQIQELKKENYKIVVTDLAGESTVFDKQTKIALVIGNESKGVSNEIKKLADQHFKIVKSGQAESLNAAVAAGIIMQQIKNFR